MYIRRGGGSITFNTIWKAGATRCFDDNITIKCAFAGAELDPHQWGAIASSSGGDDTLAVKRALAALPESGGSILLNGIYRFDPTHFTYPYNPTYNWAGKTQFRLSGLVYLINTWYIDFSSISIIGNSGGYGALSQFGVGKLSTIWGPPNGSALVIRTSSTYISDLQISAGNNGDVLVYDGTTYTNTPVANHICERCTLVGNQVYGGIPLVIKDAFWLRFNSIVMLAYPPSPYCSTISDVDPTLAGPNPVIIDFDNCITAGKSIFLGSNISGGPGLYNVRFRNVVQENGVAPMFEINSTYNKVDKITFENCFKADEVTTTPFLQNTGYQTSNITIIGDDTRNIEPIKGDPIIRPSYVGFPGLNLPRRVYENPTLFQSKKVGVYNDEIDWNNAFNKPIKLARWGSLPISASNHFNTTININQPDPQGGSSAYLVSVINPASGIGTVAWGYYNANNFTTGDWLLFGLWAKSAGDYGVNGSAFGTLVNIALPSGGSFADGGSITTCSNYKDIDTRGWQFYSSVVQIDSPGSGNITFGTPIRVDSPLFLFNPFIVRIPASENVVVDEIIAYAKQCVGLPSATPAASISVTDKVRYNIISGFQEYYLGGEFLQVGSTKKEGIFTGTTAVSIPKSIFVKRIVIKPVSNLTGFSIGTSNGGNEILPPQNVISGSWKSFAIDQYFEISGTLWFNGITSNTNFVLYYD
ncbi:MAG: hypothetical protein ACTHMM_20310 [Agriterribacter sp.]